MNNIRRKNQEEKDYINMVTKIERIIKTNNSIESSFYDYQIRRIEFLERALSDMENGRPVDPDIISEINQNWKDIGLLDENGEIAEFYRMDE